MLMVRVAILAAAVLLTSGAVSHAFAAASNEKSGADGVRGQLAVQFVTLGYGDLFERPFRSLNFTTEELSTDEAQVVLRLVKSYNDFTGDKVADALARFKGRIASYQFGREGSPVLYIRLPFWTHHREEHPKGKGTRIDDSENRELVAAIRTVFLDELAADEFDVDTPSERTIRVWWD